MPETEAADEAEEAAEENQSPLDDPEYLREQYHDEGLTQAEIGDKHDVTSSTVSHYMRKHGIETRANVITDERLEDEEWLREKYVDDEMTMQEIGDEIGCSDGTVMRRLHKYDIPVRRSATEQTGEDDEDAEEDEDAEDAEGE